MLEDRDYMRQTPGGLKLSATVMLLAVNLVIFLLEPTIFNSVVPDQYLILSLEGLKHGFLWQLITYQFLHASWTHLIFNSVALYFFGRPVESVLGKSRFLKLYFISGIVGGLTQILFAVALPQFFNAPILGASAGISGVVAAFTVMSWDSPFTLLIYFFPVKMTGKTLFLLSITLAVAGLLSPVLTVLSRHYIPGSNIAHAAHLGGFLAGFVSVSWVYGYRRGY